MTLFTGLFQNALYSVIKEVIRIFQYHNSHIVHVTLPKI